MSKSRSGGKKQSRDRMFKQMKVKKNTKSDEEKVKEFKQAKKEQEERAKEPVTREELYKLQNAFNVRVDSALMGIGAVVEILVKKDICTYEEFKNGERNMLKILQYIRKSMVESYKMLGETAKTEDIGAYIYEKSAAFGINKEILTNIFGVKPSESRIIKPSSLKIIR